MDSQIQALTDKVYQEGVLKGEEEARKIVEQAEVEAERIEAEAEAKAQRILSEAERMASERKENTERELKLYAAQLVEATRASLVDTLTGRIASDNVEALQTSPEFIQSVVLELVKGFDLQRGVEITTAQSAQLEEYFARNAKALLEAGVTIKNVAGKAVEFSVSPKDGSFKLQIGESEFRDLFKSILRPQLSQQLF